MRIGLIARADHTGLGIQSKEFYDHIPCKVLLIDSSPMMPGLPILKPNLDWYPGAQVFALKPGYHGMTGMMSRHEIEEFIKDIDILFAIETAYDYDIFTACRERGIKTILQLNYEFLDFPSNLPWPDLFAAPSLWNYDFIPGNKVYLPVPVNKSKFTASVDLSINSGLSNFVHIAGRPAYQDRNGTMTVVNAIPHIKSKIKLNIRSQLRYVHAASTDNVLVNDQWEDRKNYCDNYDGGVLVLPRKFGGLCLPFNEALAAGMPVITTNIDPNNKWLPSEWLVEASEVGFVRSKKVVPYYEADPVKLAEKIDEFCDPEFYMTAVKKAIEISETISWQTLLPLYKQTFENLLK